MVRLHLLSDLHLEFDDYKPAFTGADVVILAGDISTKARGVRWASEVFSCPVLYVPGNHEYYSGHFPRMLEKMRMNSAGTNVHVLDRDAIVISGVRFLGATMWTDFASTGSATWGAITARTVMNDYKQIRAGENFRRLKPEDLAEESAKTRLWLQGQLDKPFPGKTVVITHHAPLMRSLAEYPDSGTHVDASYANDWKDLMGLEKVTLWVHGHSHQAVDYEEAGTRIVSNPLGYAGEKTGFDPKLTITI